MSSAQRFRSLLSGPDPARPISADYPLKSPVKGSVKSRKGAGENLAVWEIVWERILA